MADDKASLLNQLRIERGSRESSDEPGSRKWIVVVALVLLAVLGLTASFFLLHGKRFEVEAATAVAPASSGAPAAVLQATGYVTARRQATVSAQITGALSEVLIEEGEYVQAGQVLARLENTAQQAALAQAQAQLRAAEASRGQFEAQL